MSQQERDRLDDSKEDENLMSNDFDMPPPVKSRALYILTESILLVASIPTLIFFVFGVINGLLLLIQQDEQVKWIATKKLAAVAAGNSASSIKDRMEDHLTGSTVVIWVLVLIYTQILFSVSKFAYPFWGLAYLICLVGGLIFHIVGIVWIADEDCTDTDWYLMALSNTIVYFIFSTLILIGGLICFFIGNSKAPKQKVKPQEREENVEESEERILPREENKEEENQNDKEKKEKESNGEEHKEGETVDKEKNENKDEEEDLEEEEIY